MVPPNFLTIRMSLKSTLMAVSGSITFKTASTAIGDRTSELVEMTLEEREVLTHWMRVSLLEI